MRATDQPTPAELDRKKEGKYRWNYLDAVPIRDIYDRWINKYASPSVEMLGKLKKDLES